MSTSSFYLDNRLSPKTASAYLKIVLACAWLALICSGMSVRAEISLSEALDKLTAEQEEKVKKKLLEQLPSLFVDKEDEGLAAHMVRNIKRYYSLAKDVRDGKAGPFNEHLVDASADYVDWAIKKRFPDPDSSMRRFMSSVQEHPELAKNIGRAALSPDKVNWRKTIKKSLSDYANKKYQENLSEGIAFWKRLGRHIVYTPKVLDRIGQDPFDLYVHGIKSWADFVGRTQTRFHNAILNCFAKAYQEELRLSGSKHAARDVIATTKLKGHKCDDKTYKGTSIGTQISNMFRRLASGASTEGRFPLGVEDILDLLEEYQTDPERQSMDFSDWVEKRFNKNLKAQQQALNDTLDKEHQETSKEQQKRARDISDILDAAIENAVENVLGKEVQLTAVVPEQSADELKSRGNDEGKGGTDKDRASEVRADEKDDTHRGEALACIEPKRAFYDGWIEYRMGNEDAFARALDSTKSLLADRDENHCRELRQKVTKGASQVTLLKNLKHAVGQTLKQCQPAKLSKLTQLMEKTNHPYVVKLKSKLYAASEAAFHIDVARSGFQLGRFDESLEALQTAKRSLNKNDLDCAPLRKKIAAGLEAIRQASKQNVHKPKEAPTADPKVQSVSMVEAANKCKAKMGPNAIAVRSMQSLSGYSCQCSKPFQLTLGSCLLSEVVDTKFTSHGNEIFEQKKAAGRNEAKSRAQTCLKKFGKGYFVGRIMPNGTFYCRPSQAAANAWCRSHNKGKGWKAGRVSLEGGFNCVRSKRYAQAEAIRYCKRQWGNRFSHVSFNQNGSYICQVCNKGQIARQGRCYSTAPRRPAVRRQKPLICPPGYQNAWGVGCIRKLQQPKCKWQMCGGKWQCVSYACA